MVIDNNIYKNSSNTAQFIYSYKMLLLATSFGLITTIIQAPYAKNIFYL